MSLMTSRRFAPLFWCQFFAAFGDNFLKTALVFVILFEMAGANAAVADQARRRHVDRAVFLSVRASAANWPTATTRPSSPSASSSPRSAPPRSRVAGFAFHSLSMLFVARVSVRQRSPRCSVRSNTASCPTCCKREELPSGNALIEGGTFLAILLGTIVAGVAANGNSNPIHFAWLMILTALVSWLSSLLIPKTGEGAPDLRDQSQHPGLDRLTASSRCAPIRGCGGAPSLRAGSGWSARSFCRCCRRWCSRSSAAANRSSRCS